MANGDIDVNIPPGNAIPRRRGIPHYHGDEVRILFVIIAVLIIVAESTGADLPISTTGAVLTALILVVAAGITNPVIGWIHWVNSILAIFGTLVFGIAAVQHYRLGLGFFVPSFLYTEALAILSLIALYLTTRTIRGMFLKITSH